MIPQAPTHNQPPNIHKTAHVRVCPTLFVRRASFARDVHLNDCSVTTRPQEDVQSSANLTNPTWPHKVKRRVLPATTCFKIVDVRFEMHQLWRGGRRRNADILLSGAERLFPRESPPEFRRFPLIATRSSLVGMIFGLRGLISRGCPWFCPPASFLCALDGPLNPQWNGGCSDGL